MNQERKFNGFSSSTLDFLNSLQTNNNKSWFEAHKPDYQKHLLEPLHNLAVDLSRDMLAIDPVLVVGSKAVSRIYRDTRFARDKSPYKTTMWLTFKRPQRDWMDAPAYFFEIAPATYRYGMGYYSAAPETMHRLREALDANPQEFHKAISFFPKQKVFVVEGEKYKKVLNENKPEEIRDWYQRKNFYLVCNRKIDQRLLSGHLVDDLLSGFNLVAPFYHYLMQLKDRQPPRAFL